MDTKQNINLKILSIAGYDFRYAFAALNIYEDLLKSSYTGTITVMETEGVREAVPIIGEEVGVVQFCTVEPVAQSEHDDILFTFRINKIENLREGSSNQRYYRMHFTSINYELNVNARVRKHYRGTADQVVSRLMKAHFGAELETVDPARHEQSFVFPNWHPFQCINYMSGISVSTKYNDPYYLFYEDRNGFHFTTLSALMDKPAVETIDMKMANIKPEDDTWDKLQLSTFSTNPLFDCVENYLTGMYGNTRIMYDKINRIMKEAGSTYSGTHGKFKHVGQQKLTKAKPENPKNKFQFIMNNKPSNPGVYSHTDEWANLILHRAAQLRNNRFHVTVNGKSSIKLGDVIKWDLRSTREGVDYDEILSGKYLITKIRHIIGPNTYSQQMEIIKDGLG